MKLVILNSCQGANDSASKPLSGVAPHLISQGLPAVIAMQYPVPDDVAKLFAGEFYSSLCVGADQGRVDAAISYARKSICQDFEHSKGFATPVLLMRSPTGIIFDLQKHKLAITSVEELHLAKDIEKARTNNIAVLKSQEAEAPLAEKEKIVARIQEEQEEVIATKKKIRKWRQSVLLRTLVIFLAVSLAYWTHLFNLLNLDDWVERKFIAAVMEPHMQNKPFWDKLELILINDGDNGSAGAFNPNIDPTSKQR
jgi:hypothetical protein